MGEMDYSRYKLEADHVAVMNGVRRYVFYRTDFEEKWADAVLPEMRRRGWPSWPKTLRECLFFPLGVFFMVVWQVFFHAFWTFIRSSARKITIRNYASGLKRAAKEWKETERWLNHPGIRDTMLRVDVPDEDSGDPFFVAERISRILLTEKRIRGVFEHGDFINRIAMSALVLAEIGFADYREFDDPGLRRRRPRREF